ncbi:MAG: ABC transporter permease subunit [Acidimicrobiales bacterium]
MATARRANRAFDRVSTFRSFGLLGIPNFALGVVILYFLSLKWEIFPAGYDGQHGTFQELKSLTLPALTLGLGLAATYQRLLRTDLITTLQEDFVHISGPRACPRAGSCTATHCGRRSSASSPCSASTPARSSAARW